MSSQIAEIQESKRRNILVYLLSAPQDEEICEEISKHLRLREFPSKIELDSDFTIPSGTDREQYKKKLFEADIVLALISVDFIDNDDVYDRTKRVIERYNNKKTIIIPLLVRNCLWKATPFANLEVLPRNYQPLNNKQFWPSPDDALMAVVTDIHSSLSELAQRGGVQLSSIDAAESRPDTAVTSQTSGNQTALLDSASQQAAENTTAQRVPAAEAKDASEISIVSEVPGSATAAAPPISGDWRKKYRRIVLLKRGAALLIDNFIIVVIIIILAMAAGATAEEADIVGICGGVLYMFIICPIMESSRWRGSFGKMIMRIQITDRDGNRISLWRAFLRNGAKNLVHMFYYFSAGLGLIWQIISFLRSNKLFHDKWSGTVVGEKLAGAKTSRLAVRAA